MVTVDYQKNPIIRMEYPFIWIGQRKGRRVKAHGYRGT